MGVRIQNVKAVEQGGIHFRSKLEAKTADILNKLKIPFNYEKRKIILLKSFKSPFQKNKIRQVTYTPDFEIGPVLLECKGFETPEWKIKKKMVLWYLLKNEPDTIFYQIHDAGKQLLQVLDNHWSYLNYKIQVIKKAQKKQPEKTFYFESIKEALEKLDLKGRALGPILNSLIKKRESAYGYVWNLTYIKEQ